jgi:hypothetical protein
MGGGKYVGLSKLLGYLPEETDFSVSFALSFI